MKKGDLNKIFLSLFIIIGILFLRLITNYPNKIINFNYSIIIILEKLMIFLGFENIITFFKNEVFPSFAIILYNLFNLVVSLILLHLFRNFILQGTQIIKKKVITVMAIGNILYFLLIILFFMFTISVVGLPMSFIISFIIYILNLSGNIPLSIFFGYRICKMFNISNDIYIDYLLGKFFLTVLQSIYLIGLIFTFYIFPIFSIGIVFIFIINKFVFYFSYDVNIYNKKKFDNNKIKNIIKKDL